MLRNPLPQHSPTVSGPLQGETGNPEHSLKTTVGTTSLSGAEFPSRGSRSLSLCPFPGCHVTSHLSFLTMTKIEGFLPLGPNSTISQPHASFSPYPYPQEAPAPQETPCFLNASHAAALRHSLSFDSGLSFTEPTPPLPPLPLSGYDISPLPLLLVGDKTNPCFFLHKKGFLKKLKKKNPSTDVLRTLHEIPPPFSRAPSPTVCKYSKPLCSSLF